MQIRSVGQICSVWVECRSTHYYNVLWNLVVFHENIYALTCEKTFAPGQLFGVASFKSCGANVLLELINSLSPDHKCILTFFVHLTLTTNVEQLCRARILICFRAWPLWPCDCRNVWGNKDSGQGTKAKIYFSGRAPRPLFFQVFTDVSDRWDFITQLCRSRKKILCISVRASPKVFL